MSGYDPKIRVRKLRQRLKERHGHKRRQILRLAQLDGIAGDVIPAKAGIQTWRPMRPSPPDSRFRGNGAGEGVIGFVFKQRALGPEKGNDRRQRRLMALATTSA
jgi:hypothetical protein